MSMSMEWDIYVSFSFAQKPTDLDNITQKNGKIEANERQENNS